MHVKRKTYLTVAAVFAFMFLLLLSFIPDGKASAATKTYSVACTGDKVYYGGNSQVTKFTGDTGYVSFYCSNPGSFTITVKPNTSTSLRTITLYAKKGNGTTVDTIKISQPGIATKTINVGCTGGNMYYYNANAYSYIYSNTLVCNSRSNNNFVVKPNTNSQARSCKVTVKNRAGNILAYVTINQSGVPGKTINVSSTGGNYAHGVSGVYSVSSSNTSICSGLTSDKKSLIVKPSTSTSVRRCTVTMRNSAGKVIAYVAITQSGVPVKTVSASGDSGAKFSYGNSNTTSFSYSSSYVSRISASNPGSFTIYLKENPSPSKTRTFDIIAKNSKGAYVEIIRVTQAKHTVTSKTLNVACTGGNVYYANSIASTYTYSNTSICNSRSGNYFVVKPNSSTAARTCTVTVKNSAGEVVGYVYIKQSGVPTKTINAACTGGNYTHGISGVYSATSDNTSICSGLTSDKKSLIVKPNTTTSARNCRVTLKNSSSKVIAYVYIKQAAVPVKNVSLSGGYTSFAYYKSGATSFSYTSSQVYNVTCSNPYSYTLYVTANPNASASRTFNVIAKNSSGAYLEIIKVTQAKTAYSTVTSNYNSDPRTITLSAANADYSKTVISNTSMCTKGSTSTKFNLTQNTSTNARSCTVTFKDKYGAIVKKCVIKQAGVPLKEISVVGDDSNFAYGNSNATSFVLSNPKMIYNVKATNPGSFVLYVSANPSSTSNRTSDIIVKNSAGAYLEIIRVTQSKFVVPSKSESYNSDPRTVTFTCPGAVLSKTTYSNSSMFKTGKSLGNGKYQFSVSQNPNSSSRRNKVTFKDQFGTPIATYTVIQTGVPLKTKTISKGTAWMIYYSNDDASCFSYDNQNVSSISASNPGEFRITITANPSTTKNRTFDIIAKRSNGTYAEIIRVTQPPHTHNYVYTLTGDTLSRKCSICSDKDNDITYQEYLTYKNLSDSESSVKTYMSALGYASNSKETNGMVNAYNYLKKNNNMTTASKLANVQNSLQNMKSIADDVAIFANNDKLNNSLTVLSAANHAYMFFTSKDNTAIRFSSAVDLAADAFGTIKTPFIGDYLSSGLSTVAKALSDNLPKAFNYKDKTFASAMIEYDSAEGEGVVENSTYNELANNQDIKSDIKELYGGKFEKAADDYFKKLLNWKASYEEQKSYEVLYKAIDPSYKAPVYTGSFWDFVEYQLD